MAEGGEQQGGGLLVWGSCGCAILAAIIALLFMFFALGFVGTNTTGGWFQEQTGGTAGGGGEGPVEGSCAEKLVKKASTTSPGKDNPKAIIDKVNEAQAKFGGDAALRLAQLQQESHFNPSAGSSAGAQGIAQFMPGTWAGYGQDGNSNGVKNPLEWEDGIYAQAVYMKFLEQKYNGNIERALRGYNAGPGAEDSGVASGYSETQNYVKNIMAFYQEYKKCLSGGDLSGVSVPTGNIKKIYLHWTAGSYNFVSDDYTYVIKGDGTKVQKNGREHTENRNSNSVGISVAAMDDSPMSCYKNLFGDSACTYPVTKAQIDQMVSLAAEIAKKNGIPITKQYVMSHGEAGSLVDYPEDKVRELMKRGNTGAAASALGLPHNNYGPYFGGPSTRWEFYQHEDELRAMISEKLNQLK